MMRPHLRAFMPGTAARMAWKADDRLMAMIWSHFSIGNSSIGETNWMPALLTSISTDPKVFSWHRRPWRRSRRLAHVGAGIDRLDPEILFDAAALFFDRVLVAKAVDGDVGAVRRQGARDGQADARGRTGDQGDFPLSMTTPKCIERHPSRGAPSEHGLSEPNCRIRGDFGTLLIAAQHENRATRHVFAIPRQWATLRLRRRSKAASVINRR